MKPTVICLTPVRNEAWILDRFLKAASLWADHIIIADQMSTDGSREIALKYDKVKIIDNPDEEYDEAKRQKLLIKEARKIEGPRLLITLDADEIFSPNILASAEWLTLLNSKPGTVFCFKWANFCPDLKLMWISNYLVFGYMDDGYQGHSENIIHSPRIPNPQNFNVLYLNNIKIIHFQYTDWHRMQHKHRYYQVVEKINFPQKSALDIIRTYHHMYSIPKEEKIEIPEEWITEYNKLGVDITSLYCEPENWFEKQILKIIRENGASKFRKLRIWDINWARKAEHYGIANIEIYKDPRKKIDKIIHNFITKTQPIVNSRKITFIDGSIKLLFKY